MVLGMAAVRMHYLVLPHVEEALAEAQRESHQHQETVQRDMHKHVEILETID